MIKSARTVYTEGSLYVIIAAGAPIVELLISDREITTRAIVGVVVMAIVAGANALKAFLSQSIAAGGDPIKTEIVNKPSDPIPTEETNQ